MINYILTYLLCGVIFNLLFDMLINTLGEEMEENRFTMLERIVVTLTWPIHFFKFIIGFFTTLKK